MALETPSSRVKRPLRLHTHETGEDCRCVRLKCFTRVSEENRRRIIKELNLISSSDEQSRYISQFIDVKYVKGHRIRKEITSRTALHENYFGYRVRVVEEGSWQELQVCHKAFLSIYGISQKHLLTLQKSLIKYGIPHSDGRGRHGNRPYRIGHDIVNAIRRYIGPIVEELKPERFSDGSFQIPKGLTAKNMHANYMELHPNKPVSYEFFRKTYKEFGRRASHTSQESQGEVIFNTQVFGNTNYPEVVEEALSTKTGDTHLNYQKVEGVVEPKRMVVNSQTVVNIPRVIEERKSEVKQEEELILKDEEVILSEEESPDSGFEFHSVGFTWETTTEPMEVWMDYKTKKPKFFAPEKGQMVDTIVHPVPNMIKNLKENSTKPPERLCSQNIFKAISKAFVMGLTICQLCDTEALSQNELRSHYKVQHNILFVTSENDMKVIKRHALNSQIIVPLDKQNLPNKKFFKPAYFPMKKISGDESLPPKDPLAKHASSNLDMKKECYYIASLKRIPESRRNATREKMEELINLIVNGGLDPNLIRFSI